MRDINPNEIIGFETFSMGEGLLHEVIQYRNRFALFRELIVNGLDQYAHQDLRGKVKPIIIIQLDRVKRIIWIHDNATGIEDIKDFLRMGTLDTTGKTGKKVGDQESTRLNIHEYIKGKKHIGKGSSVFGSETGTVEFFSNNGTIGYYLRTNGLRWCKFKDEMDNEVLFKRVLPATEAKPERGLTVKISNAFPELLDLKKVEDKIVQWLGLRIARGARIYLEDIRDPNSTKRLEKPKDLRTTEDKHDPADTLALTLKSGRRIKTCLEECEKTPFLNIDVYVSQVWVKAMHFGYKVKGWVEDPELVENLQREDFIEDDELGAHAEFIGKFEPFLDRHYPKTGSEDKDNVRRKESKSLNQLASLLQKAFAEKFGSYTKPIYGIKTEALTNGPQMDDIEKTENTRQRKKPEKEPFMEDVEFINGGGNATTEEVITKGNGHRGRGETHGVLTDETPTDNNGPGDDSSKRLVVKSEEETGRDAYRVKTVTEIETTVPTEPESRVWPEARDDERMVFVDNEDPACERIIANIAKAQIKAAWDAGDFRRKILLQPLVVKAMVNFHIKERHDVSRELYEQMLDTMYETALGAMN